MPKITLDWLIGFTEGEGCFTSLGKYNNTTLNGKRWYYRRFQPQFLIAQKGRQVLDDIVIFLKKYDIVANVWLKKNYQHKEDERYQNHELRVCGFKNCKKIIKLFNNNLRVDYKRKQFEKWKREILNICISEKVKSEDLIRPVESKEYKS